jgi:hypothetical protein
MDNIYVYVLLGLPIAFFFGTLTYQISKLTILWIKFKLTNYKETMKWILGK